MQRCETLGEAKMVARQNAKRDGCNWNIWWNNYYSRYDVVEPFGPRDVFWSKLVYVAKPLGDIDKNPDGLVSLTITPEQAELIQWILEDEEDRQVYPGSEESKRSLLHMLIGRKK